MESNDSKIPQFICDENLGRLARYLRVGGFNTLFERQIDNSRLIKLSLDDRRQILTRDRRLIERRLVRYYFLISHDLWPDQLKAVIDHFGLVFRQADLFSRCLEDNTPIVSVEKEKIKSVVYPYTYANFDNFRQCPTCRRVFWAGTHVEAMIKNLRRAGISVID
jgi:uncharacterized protein with PIN domain